MKAVILAGGQSLRLRPLTHDRPKCLLKIGNKAIIDFQIESLAKFGITEVVVVTGYQAELLESYLLASHPKIKFHFVRNLDYATTRAAHGLWVARKFLTGPILYLNADVLCEPAIIEKVLNASSDSATAVQKIPWDEEEVNVIIDSKNTVLEIGKHIKESDNHGEFIGVTKLGQNFINQLVDTLEQFTAAGDKNRFAVDVINQVIQSTGERLAAVDITGHLAIEIDTPEDYENAHTLWQDFMTKI